MTRADGRTAGQLRPVTFEPGFQMHPAGSCLVGFGDTKVICAASHEDRGPRWKPTGGWVTGEYVMLPGSTAPRARRPGRPPGGRIQEIQRLIGRSLRSVVDLDALPECTITVDCDVLQADGGTRTASITGGWVALMLGFKELGYEAAMVGQVAAVSVGIIDGEARLDLPYEEDARAEVDMNVVATSDGRLVEVQGTAEGEPFDRSQLDELVDLAVAGCEELFALQRAVVEGA